MPSQSAPFRTANTPGPPDLMPKRSRGCCTDLGGACHRPLRVRVSPESWRRQVDCQVHLPSSPHDAGAVSVRALARVVTDAPLQARNCRADLLWPVGAGRACLPKVESLPCAQPSRCRTGPRHRIRAPPRGHPGRTPESGTPRNASSESRHVTRSRFPRKPDAGVSVAGSCVPATVSCWRPRPDDPGLSVTHYREAARPACHPADATNLPLGERFPAQGCLER
jgi:hypothetical protein